MKLWMILACAFALATGNIVKADDMDTGEMPAMEESGDMPSASTGAPPAANTKAEAKKMKKGKKVAKAKMKKKNKATKRKAKKSAPPADADMEMPEGN